MINGDDLFLDLRSGLVHCLHPNDPRRDDPNLVQPNGRLVTKDDYPELWEILGTKYGAGPNEGEFHLPEFRGRVRK